MAKLTREVMLDVIEDIASGDTSLRQACKNRKVSHTQFLRNIGNDQELCDQYARAKESQAELIAMEIMSISDESCGSNVEVQRNRLRIDSRKWLASKLLPKKYGERSQVELTGQDGGDIKSAITVKFIKSDNGEEV